MKIINNIPVIILLINIFQITISYIVIPFKTFKHPESNQQRNIVEDFLWTNLNNTIYIEIEVGSPAQKIPALLLSEEFGIFINNNKCIIPSTFNTEKSTTFSKSKLLIQTEKNKNDIILGNDIFTFPTELSSNKQAQTTLNFIYSPNQKNAINDENNNINLEENNNNQYTCAKVGISGTQNYGEKYEKNMMHQLYDKSIIKNNLFSIIYLYSPDSNDEGIFLIGGTPHEYDNKNYFEQQLVIINNENDKYFKFWSMEPDEIYFTINNKKYSITNNLICNLEYNLGLIYGTEDYLNLIRENFFNKLIKEKKCYENIGNSIFTVFYCDNKIDIEKFPSLNFYFKDLLYAFNLDYKDLFVENNGKYFFKIIFDKNNKYQWKLGKPFLEKYVFIYDYDSKNIKFYKENPQKLNKLKKLSYTILMNIIVLIIITFFCYIGYYYGKKIYIKAITEREDGYEYEYKFKVRGERVQANSFIEMIVESKVLEE